MVAHCVHHLTDHTLIHEGAYSAECEVSPVCEQMKLLSWLRRQQHSVSVDKAIVENFFCIICQSFLCSLAKDMDQGMDQDSIVQGQPLKRCALRPPSRFGTFLWLLQQKCL